VVHQRHGSSGANLRYGRGRGHPQHPGALAGRRLPGAARGPHGVRFDAGRHDHARGVDRRQLLRLGELGDEHGRGQRLGRRERGLDIRACRDLGGMPDFGNDSPVGCKGKIDFLFVISRGANMQYRQAQLAAAFPQFIDTIQSKFADFDYHIMVVDGDGGLGQHGATCNELCPNLACKVGEPCCNWYHQDAKGTPCCPPDYPCQDLDLVTACDWAWGAGTVFPAGSDGEANKPCPIDGGRRYLVKGQSNLEETFACIATVGASGYDLLGQALTAAMQSNINDPGGCNNGFLRKDALLMVTFISTNPDVKGKESAGTPAEWAQAVLDAKHGDDKSVVMLNIGYFEAATPRTALPGHEAVPVPSPRVRTRRRLRAGVRRGREPRRDRVRRLHAAAGVKARTLSCRCGRTRPGRRRRCPRRRPRRRAPPPPRARSEALSCRSG
jgi:hypothetical protein